MYAFNADYSVNGTGYYYAQVMYNVCIQCRLFSKQYSVIAKEEEKMPDFFSV